MQSLSAMLVGLLCTFGQLSFEQTAESDRASNQSSAQETSIRVESDLVVVRAMVANKKIWNRGPTEAAERCAEAEKETLARLPATVPYLPKDCLGFSIRGLTASDFHVFVDGVEQRIRAVTTETSGIRVRDNQGRHIEFSETPVGRWSSADYRVPGYAYGYGFEAANRYDIAFAPDKSARSGCHRIRVKVDKRDSIVEARNEYCGTESPFDTLNGTEFGKLIEADLATGRPGDIPVSLQTDAFCEGKDKGLVRVAMEFPWDLLNHKWDKEGAMNATIGALGIVRGQDGSFMARFSDLACCRPYSTVRFLGVEGSDFNNELGLSLNTTSTRGDKFGKARLPARYETQFELAPGEYDLQVVLSDGEKFGRAEAHLSIEKCDGKHLALSSVMLCKRFRDAHVAAVETAATNIAPQYVPMVSKGIQVSPAGDNDFKAGELLIPYFEIYAPHATGEPMRRVQAHLRIVAVSDGATVKDFPPVDAATYSQQGSTTIPIAREVPITTLPKGEYRLEVQASDSTGRSTPWRSANFAITDKK